jgi:mannitol 2-dehydrogenase
VLEDRFPAGRPPLERVGVTFASDVTPFELMKIRILNGGHAVIAYPAGLLGIHYVHEAMEHPAIAAFLDRLTRDEIMPAVPPVPGMDLGDYKNLIATRFANPKIGDTIRRLCFDGSNRQPKFIVPTIAEAIGAGRGFDGLALESALWCRYCAGVDDRGQPIEANDPAWARLNPIALAARDNPQAWLDMTDIYGSVGRHGGFAGRFAHWLSRLNAVGTEGALAEYLAAR